MLRRRSAKMDLNNTEALYNVRNRITTDYISDIRRTTPMTAEEEKDLWMRYRASVERLKTAMDGQSGIPESTKKSIERREESIQREIRDAFITRNQRFVYAMAKRYNNPNILMDLVSSGLIGLMEAFDRFDETKGNRFMTFATWYIRRAMNAYIMKDNLTVRNSSGSLLYNKKTSIENKFFAENGRLPMDGEIKEIMKAQGDRRVNDMTDIGQPKMSSIDVKIDNAGDDGADYGELGEFAVSTASTNDYEREIESDAVTYAVNRALRCLPEKERQVLCMSAGIGCLREYKDGEVAEIMGMTSERVRQIRMSAKRRFSKIYNSQLLATRYV